MLLLSLLHAKNNIIGCRKDAMTMVNISSFSHIIHGNKRITLGVFLSIFFHLVKDVLIFVKFVSNLIFHLL